jgi:hypothetical protein
MIERTYGKIILRYLLSRYVAISILPGTKILRTDDSLVARIEVKFASKLFFC